MVGANRNLRTEAMLDRSVPQATRLRCLAPRSHKIPGRTSEVRLPHPDIADAFDWPVRLRENQPALDDRSFLVVNDGRVVGDIGPKVFRRKEWSRSATAVPPVNADRASAPVGAHNRSPTAPSMVCSSAECRDDNHGFVRVLARANFAQTGTRDDGADHLDALRFVLSRDRVAN